MTDPSSAPPPATLADPATGEPPKSFGVFKPVDHVVMSFPDAAAMQRADAALAPLGLAADDVHRYTDRQMVAQIDDDLKHASPLAALGQEINLVKAHRELAERGYHWLVVKARDDEHARAIADAAKAAGAERAQHYGNFIIEELIEHRADERQVAESPDRGLDAQTASGHEAERTSR